MNARLVRIVLYVHPAALQQVDEIAWLTARTRAAALRDCLSWGLAREHAWRQRQIAVQLDREERQADELQATERARRRYPERFDAP